MHFQPIMPSHRAVGSFIFLQRDRRLLRFGGPLEHTAIFFGIIEARRKKPILSAPSARPMFVQCPRGLCKTCPGHASFASSGPGEAESMVPVGDKASFRLLLRATGTAPADPDTCRGRAGSPADIAGAGPVSAETHGLSWPAFHYLEVPNHDAL